MAKLSVIVPVYGVEDYIGRCVDSLFSQTLEDVEFIFIDDASPDASMKLLEEKRMQYRHKMEQMHWSVITDAMSENRGLPAVRRRGIELAGGEYVAHIDSDDWVHPDMFRAMYESAVRSGADVVVCDFVRTDGKTLSDTLKGCRTTDREQYIRRLLTQKDSWSLCNKFFRRTLYYGSGLIAPVGNMGEDFAFVLQLMLNCERIAFIPRAYYNYYHNPLSVTNVKSKEKQLANFWQNMENADIVFRALDARNLSSRFSREIVSRKWDVLKSLWGTGFDEEIRKIWKTVYPEIRWAIFTNEYITFKEKIKYVLTAMRLYPGKSL